MRIFKSIVALTAACATLSGAQAPNGTMPDMTKLYHSRQNCHLAYDLLVETSDAKGAMTPADLAFGKAYEAAATGGTPCPAPPADLARRSANRTVVERATQVRLLKFHQQKDAAAYYEAGLSVVMGKVDGVAKPEGFALIRIAQELGDPTAQFEWGNLHVLGIFTGGKPDHKSALPFIEKAADAGHLDAKWLAGSIYYRGAAGRADKKRAFDLFRSAAENGHLGAAIMTYTMIQEGDGTAKDQQLAYRIARNIADQGEVYGGIMAASALLQQKNAKANEVETLYWLDWATARGDAKIKGEIAKLRPQVAAAFKTANAPPEYRPRVRKVCPMKTVCYVNRFSGAQQSCTTNKDYYNDCDG